VGDIFLGVELVADVGHILSIWGVGCSVGTGHQWRQLVALVFGGIILGKVLFEFLIPWRVRVDRRVVPDIDLLWRVVVDVFGTDCVFVEGLVVLFQHLHDSRLFLRCWLWLGLLGLVFSSLGGLAFTNARRLWSRFLFRLAHLLVREVLFLHLVLLACALFGLWRYCSSDSWIAIEFAL
jgi:hypothetical protein